LDGGFARAVGERIEKHIKCAPGLPCDGLSAATAGIAKLTASAKITIEKVDFEKSIEPRCLIAIV
jgi:hypothetical protein